MSCLYTEAVGSKTGGGKWARERWMGGGPGPKKIARTSIGADTTTQRARDLDDNAGEHLMAGGELFHPLSWRLWGCASG